MPNPRVYSLNLVVGTRIRPCRAGLAAIVAASLLMGCSSFWTAVRERERRFAQENAQERVARGDCRGALPSLERSQAAAALGSYAASSTWTRAQCLSRLGALEESKAHYRLLRDFYPAFRPEPIAQELGEDAIALTREIAELSNLGALPELALEEPRYSASTDRSRLGGSVLVRFWVREDGTTRDIRVLDMPHPLLASWAIEAVARAKVEDVSSALLPQAGVRRFVFQTRAERLATGDTSD